MPAEPTKPTKSIKPINPSDIVALKRGTIPEQVIEVFNELIAKYWNGSQSTFSSKYVAALIAERMGITPLEVYQKGLLDIESIYEKQGWNVIFDNPGFNESYEAHFVFRSTLRNRVNR